MCESSFSMRFSFVSYQSWKILRESLATSMFCLLVLVMPLKVTVFISKHEVLNGFNMFFNTS